jgi:hypothetical protein
VRFSRSSELAKGGGERSAIALLAMTIETVFRERNNVTRRMQRGSLSEDAWNDVQLGGATVGATGRAIQAMKRARQKLRSQYSRDREGQQGRLRAGS